MVTRIDPKKVLPPFATHAGEALFNNGIIPYWAPLGPGIGDHKVMVDGADTTPAYLYAKLTAGTGITLTVLNVGGNETIQIDASAAVGITSINLDTTAAQTLTTSTTGTDFTISDPGLGSHVFNLPIASAVNTGKLSNTDWSTFNSKQNALSFGNLTDVGTDGITITGGTGAVIGAGTSISQHVADATHNGYLSSADWNTFNSHLTSTLADTKIFIGSVTNVATAQTLSLSASGGAFTLADTGVLTMPNADTATRGLLTATDWNTFNNKQNALSFGNLTDVGTDGITVTGGTGAVIGAGTSIAQHVADVSHNGYLSSTDWGIFNGKASPKTTFGLNGMTAVIQDTITWGITLTESVNFANWKIHGWANADNTGSGSIQLRIAKNGVDMVGTGNKPTLSSAQDNSAAISGWTSTTGVAGDVLVISVVASSVVSLIGCSVEFY